FVGQVHAPFREPELLLTAPDGSTARLENLSPEAQRFVCYVGFDRGPGEYQLEVMGRYDMGPRVLGLCSLFARQAGETTYYERLLAAARDGTLVPTPPLPRRSEPRTERQAEALLVRLVNRDRRRYGLSPLVEAAPLS